MVFSVNDLILILKQLENNNHVKPVKNLMISNNEMIKDLIKTICMIANDCIVNEDTTVNLKTVEKLKQNGFLTFCINKIDDNNWLDIIICTKKGQLRF